MVTFALAILISVWFGLSIIYQLPTRFKEWIPDYDRFQLVPIWTLFAPNPGCTDYHLLFRDRYDDGQFSEWRELHAFGDRGLFTALWNPNKRFRKWVLDVAQYLSWMAVRHPDNPGAILASIPYLLVQNLVTSLPNNNRVRGRQFIILETHGFC